MAFILALGSNSLCDTYVKPRLGLDLGHMAFILALGSNSLCDTYAKPRLGLDLGHMALN
jgi:hypothetical protein